MCGKNDQCESSLPFHSKDNSYRPSNPFLLHSSRSQFNARFPAKTDERHPQRLIWTYTVLDGSYITILLLLVTNHPHTHNLFDIVAAAAAAFTGSAAVNRVWPRFSSVGRSLLPIQSMDYPANVLRFAQGFDSVVVVRSFNRGDLLRPKFSLPRMPLGEN